MICSLRNTEYFKAGHGSGHMGLIIHCQRQTLSMEVMISLYECTFNPDADTVGVFALG